MITLNRNQSRALVLLFLTVTVLLAVVLSPQKPPKLENNTALPITTLSNMVRPFIANQGLLDEKVAYYANMFAGNVFVTKQGELVYSLLSR